MIVRILRERVQLITQPDHAQLAGRIMEHCVPLSSSPRRDWILHAIAQHDNGWTEEDASPAVNAETGAVVDFVTAPLAVRHAVWPRAIGRLARDPWPAALVAQHAITVYDRFRPDPAWTSFFSTMEAMRDEMLRASALPMADLLGDYGFVRLADLISLTFCTGWTDEQRYGQWSVRLSGTRVVVLPDVFGGMIIPIEIGAKEISSAPFRSDGELREALSAADALTLYGEVVGSEPQVSSSASSPASNSS